ncbi:MAG: RNA-guided endonuclease TnpB family protein [Aulosira sp. DedQUE10]|nr:RNA-guided endonuclease TnpB family protein [Aulosira sp. DedQUE10]
MLKAYKYRIYPTSEQAILLAKSFGCVRWFYNFALNLTSETYKATGKGLSRNDIINLLPGLKKEYEWLTQPPSQCLQQVALDLSSAFLNFFEKRAKYPNFQKKGQKQSLRFPQQVKLDGDYLTLPKLGKVYCKVSRSPSLKLKSVTVSLTPSGEYYASCLYDDGKDKPVSSSQGKAIGVDMGITHYAITSDGTKHGNPKYYRKYELRLAKRQKSFSRKQKGSKNRNKARIKVARVHSKITRCRADFLHKLSRKLVDENQVMVVENLAVKNMVSQRVGRLCRLEATGEPVRVRNSKLAKSISDAGWGQFCTMLKYKALWEGKIYIEVDRFFPSSKTCSNCLHQVDNLSLDIRSWQCAKCKTTHDRDINAAINLRDEGLRLLAGGHLATASGQRVRPSKGTAFRGNVG